MSEINNRSTYDFAAALRGEELKETGRLTPEPNRLSYDFAAMLRQTEELNPSGPAAEWTAEGPEDRGAGEDGAVSSEEETEKATDEPDEEEVEGQVKSGLSKFLESVPWKRIALEGTTIIPPMVFGGTLGYFSPETARNISVAVGSAGVGLAFTSMAAAMAERILPVHIRAGWLGKALVAAKVGGLYGGNVLLSTAIGTHVGAGIREGIEVLHAAQPAAGGGEGAMVDHPKPVDASIGQAGGLPPVVLSPQAGDFVNRAGEVAAQEAREMADAAQGAAEIVARHVAEAQAATSVGITGGELSGGTIWGNELEFVKQLGVHHVEPVTNLLKNFSKVLAQAQPPTEIGPTDTAYVINRDVAGWAAGQADKLYGMDPSSMTSWQKALWEIGRGLREANWRDLQAVTEEFVRQAKP